MWDWYNRPGGIRTVPTWKVVLVLVVSAVVITVALWLLFVLLTPILFTRVPVGR